VVRNLELVEVSFRETRKSVLNESFVEVVIQEYFSFVL
jgi:hypothetical protein